MSLQTIIRLLRWLAVKLVKEQNRLTDQSDAITKQITRLEGQRNQHKRDIATAHNIATSVSGLLDSDGENEEKDEA